MMIVVMLILSYLIGAIPNGYVVKGFFKKILDNMAVVILATNSFEFWVNQAGFIVTF